VFPDVFNAVPIFVAFCAAITDFWKHRIPNLLTLPTIVLGFSLSCLGFVDDELLNGWTAGWKFSLSGFAVGFGLTLVVSLISKGGGGDVKLAAALGTFLGPVGTFHLLGITFVSAFILLTSYFIMRDGVFSTMRLLTHTPTDGDNGFCEERRPTSASQVMLPMGPFFFVATVTLALLRHS